ncbi:type I pullulanase [Clostridium sp. WILCCON 0269]|uniref:Type I pullulanase n=1 Tax=Candidatus Clostridium eludens TaxID=3381663 RepID=A0ABW8SG55_9CLOT
MKITNIYINSFNKIVLASDEICKFKSYKLNIKNGRETISITSYSIVDTTILLNLNRNIDIKYHCFVEYEDTIYKVWYYPLYSTEEFNKRFFHNTALGAIYNKEKTTFKLWSPPATCVKLIIYEKPSSDQFNVKYMVDMKEHLGLWYTSVKGDLHETYYNYQVTLCDKCNIVVDPYASAVSINGLTGVVLDLKRTDPAMWHSDIYPAIEKYTDAIIYEVSLRDLSSHSSSGVLNRKKFLSLTEKEAKSPQGLSTCLDHILELGVTHIQLMPIFDFSCESVDERYSDKNYNWGYDPQNYNAPEGSYATNAYNPMCRIIELKNMIHFLHKNNLGITMDVVYNHIYHGCANNFQNIFPDYYFRFSQAEILCNGSGCGNDLASENLMVRKFIVDSVIFWAKEYHIDGFRFDLMGLIDINTMKLIEYELHKINKSMMIYGEGWDLNTCLPGHNKSTLNNSKYLCNIGFFNDKIRDCLKGNVFDLSDRGFIMGDSSKKDILKECIMSQYISPIQSVNYASCHDNHTLWDRINLSCIGETVEEKKKRVKLCSTIILTCPGIPFIYSGEEFCRSKQGESNSFNKPDYINSMDWDKKAEFIDVFNHYKKLIHIRKSHKLFKLHSMETLLNNLTFIKNTSKDILAFILKDSTGKDKWKQVLIAINAGKKDMYIDIPEIQWKLVLDSNYDKYDKNENILLKDKLLVKGLSSYILYYQED